MDAKTKSGKKIPKWTADEYKKLYKLPKYNGPITTFTAHGDAGKTLRYSFPEWEMQDHLDAAGYYDAESKEAQTAWGQEQEKAHLKTFGKKPEFQDYKTSGVGSDEYDEKSKKKLRELASADSYQSQLAHAHRQASRLVKKIKNFRTPVDATFKKRVSAKYEIKFD